MSGMGPGIPAMPTQPCPPNPPSMRMSPNISNQAPINFSNQGAQGMTMQQRQQMMRERQLAQLEKQRNRKPFGAVANTLVANDLPSGSAASSVGKTGWGKIIAVGIDQPGCMSEETKKNNDGGGITVVRSPVGASTTPKTLAANGIGPGTPARSKDSAASVAGALPSVSELFDDDIIDVGGCEEVKCGRNGNEAERNKILREAQKSEPSHWNLEVEAAVRGPSPILEMTTDMDEVPAAAQKKKWWKPWQKEAPAPAPTKRPVKEDTGAVTAISSFNDVPSTPPEFGGPNNRATNRMTELAQSDTRPRPGRRNRGDQDSAYPATQSNSIQSFSSQERSSAARGQVTQVKAGVEAEYSNRSKAGRQNSGDVTTITSMAVVDDDEDKPKFSRPKRNVHRQQDVLPGCLDEPEDTIGWD